MTTKQKNYRDPGEAEKIALYELYCHLYDNTFFTMAKKRSVFTALFGYEVWSWRVVGITVHAVIEIAKNNYRYPKGVLVRDHQRSRRDTYHEIFSRKYDFEEWWGFIWTNDETILMTVKEHNAKSNSNISRIIELNPRHSYFVDKEVAGFYYTKEREGAFVKSLYESLDPNEIRSYSAQPIR